MVAVLVVLLIVGVLVELGIVWVYLQTYKSDPSRYQAQLDLHTIHSRLEVAEFKREVRRKGTQARRELREELHGDGGLNKKRPGSPDAE